MSLLTALETLRAEVKEPAPFKCGVVTVEPRNLVLFYGKTRDAHRLAFTNVSNEELEHLAQACDVATFGVDQQDVLDETYRKAGKLDSDFFAINVDLEGSGLMNIIQEDLLDGKNSQRGIRAELYKLNVYGPGSFFKAHKDTPRSEKMFGSLVLIFPTPHEGGSLVLRDKGQEWTFDSATATSSCENPCIGFATFYGDVEHEVTPVVSGYRVTVTYNLYFGRTSGVHTPHTPDSLRTAFENLLSIPSFLPEGGSIAFGLNREYSIDLNNHSNLDYLRDNLKGRDDAIMKVCQTLSLTASLKIIIRDGTDDEPYGRPVLCDALPDIEDIGDYPFVRHVCDSGGIPLDDGGYYSEEDDDIERSRMKAVWVTELTKNAAAMQNYIAYGNEASLQWAYSQVCLLIEVGPTGSRTGTGKNTREKEISE